MASRGRLLLALAAAASGSQHRQRQRGKKLATRARMELVRAAPGASLADRARDDVHRHAYIRSQLAARRRRAAEVAASAFAMSLSSRAYTSTGQYFVRFRVGTPAQPFVLVADIGTPAATSPGSSAAATGPRRRPRRACSAPPRPSRGRPSRAPPTPAPPTCLSPSPTARRRPAPCAYDYRSVRLEKNELERRPGKERLEGGHTCPYANTVGYVRLQLGPNRVEA